MIKKASFLSTFYDGVIDSQLSLFSIKTDKVLKNNKRYNFL